MRRVSILLIVSALVLGFTACEKKTEPTPVVEDLSGNIAAPAWADPEEYDYSSSMTAVVQVDLKTTYPEAAAGWQRSSDDKLAAFAGDVCCGVAEPADDLFFLYMTQPAGSSSTRVSLRYYSAHFKNIFEAADAITYESDGHVGSVNEPFVPAMKVVK